MLVGASKHHVIIIGILSEMIIIDIHHCAGDLVPDYSIATLPRYRQHDCNEGKKDDGSFHVLIILAFIVNFIDDSTQARQAGQQALQQVKAQHIGAVALGY